MSKLEQQIAALEAAIATGAMEVQQGAERVKYRSLSEQERTLARLKAELAGTSALRPTHFNPQFDRGI